MSTVDVAQLGTLSLEGSVSLLIFVLAVKLYKMRVHTESGCCGDALLVTTGNPGSDTGPPLVKKKENRSWFRPVSIIYPYKERALTGYVDGPVKARASQC